MKHKRMAPCPWDDENYADEDNADISAEDAVEEVPPTPDDLPADLSPIEKVSQTQLVSGDVHSMTGELPPQIFNKSSKDNINKRQPIVVVEEEPRNVLTKKGWRPVSKPLAEVSVHLSINKNVSAAVEKCIRNSGLESFDRIVLEICATHQYHGKDYITVNTIFKYMGGNGDPDPKMRQRIIDSVDKLRGLDIRIDATEAYQKLHRLQRPLGKPKRKPDKQGKIVLVDNLLSAKRLEIEVDGHILDAIKFKDVSPIFLYTQDKGETQVLSQKLLAASRLRATKNFIVLKHYILSRVRSMARSKKNGTDLKPTITFQAIYKNCGDPEKAQSDRMFRKRVRDATVVYLNSLVEEKEICEFHCVDDNFQPQTETAKCTKILIKFSSK